MSLLTDFRRQKDELMAQTDSPLTSEDRASFSGLKYFEESSSLVFDVPLDMDVVHDMVTLETSTGDQRRYARAGKIVFRVDDVDTMADVYEDEHGYFLPFRDATSSHESYSAGRYLEPERTDDDRLHVDFNYAYNPYCAYSPHFSCPLPPIENWLKVPIRAGEKKFHEQ